jgi:hypothetical protein
MRCAAGGAAVPAPHAVGGAGGRYSPLAPTAERRRIQRPGCSNGRAATAAPRRCRPAAGPSDPPTALPGPRLSPRLAPPEARSGSPRRLSPRAVAGPFRLVGTDGVVCLELASLQSKAVTASALRRALRCATILLTAFSHAVFANCWRAEVAGSPA